MTHSTPSPSQADLPAPSSRSRKAGRFNTSGLTCSAGKITDLSKDGMRVISRSTLKGTFTIELVDRNASVYIAAEVVWTKRLGLFRKEYGLRFLDVPRDTATQLARIAHGRSRQAAI